MTNPRVFVAQLGARRNHAVAVAFHQEGLLSRLVTDLCPVMSARVRSAGIPRSLIKCYPLLAVRYALARRRAVDADALFSVYLRYSSEFARRSAGYLSGREQVVYGLNTAAKELFEAANRRGLPTVLEQTIAPFVVEQYWVREALKRYPGTEQPVSESLVAKMAERERTEWELASLVLSPSSFVTDALVDAGVDRSKIKSIPYGLNAKLFDKVKPPSQGRLRVVTVGSVGLRKGTPVVLDTAERCKDFADFRLVGPFSPGWEADRFQARNVEFFGKVEARSVQEHLAWADVFFLPSICEGSAQSSLEALAAGLPLLVSPNVGSVLTHGREGILVDPFDVDGNVKALNTLADDVSYRNSLSSAAKMTAQHYSQENYAAHLRATVLAIS